MWYRVDVNQDTKFIVKLKNKQNKSRGGGGSGVVGVVGRVDVNQELR